MQPTNVIALRREDQQAERDLLRLSTLIHSGEITGAYAILCYPDGSRTAMKIGDPIPCPLLESCL